MLIASLTDKGIVRESNQDSYAAGELSGGVAWVVVCDGMGGANGGNIASALAVKSISESINANYREGMSSNSIRDLLLSATASANVSLYDTAQSVEALKGMGTTVVAAIIASGVAHIVHAGDSRAYIYKDGSVYQITKDHSVVQSMIDDGKLTTNEAKKYPGKNIIVRALGVDRRTEGDYNEVNIDEGDMFIACTDGLTNFVEDDKIASVINENPLKDCPKILIDMANQNGGRDNITVVLVSR